MSANHPLGFRTLYAERSLSSLPLEGHLPTWLAGSLYRIGPGKFEAGGRTVSHWFDGFSMLHRFSIAAGRVGYANRFLASKAYRAAEQEGKIRFSEFATDPCRSLFGRVAAVFRPPITDNANVNLARLGAEFVAMTEAPLPVLFDPQTLAAAGVASKAPGEHTTAHPHRDPVSGDSLFYAVKFGLRSSYRLYLRRGVREQREIVRWRTPRPSYMHSFAVTERFALLAECPFTVNPLDLVLSGRPFIENYRWRAELGTTLTVIDLASGEAQARVEAEPFFCFHHVNAFEDGSELVVDLIAYEDATIVESLYLEALRSGTRQPRPRLRRYRVPLHGDAARAETIEEDLELPRIDYARDNGRAYRHVYGVSGASETGAPTAIKKVDVTEGRSREWSAPGCYPGEPVFVPSPRARRADDGVLLSLVLEPASETSHLLVLDARDLSEVCRARAPHPVPFGFHGEFFGQDELGSDARVGPR